MQEMETSTISKFFLDNIILTNLFHEGVKILPNQEKKTSLKSVNEG